MAQINDSQAIAIARPIVERFAPEASNAAPSIYRETLGSARGQTIVIHANFDDFVVFLTDSGEFRALTNMGGERRVIHGDEPNKYATDEDAWRALEAILADFEIPNGLTRKELVRDAPGGEEYIMRFVMHPRPYGYAAEGGNAVYAAMHQKTGRLRSLRISKGWTYEPPNIRISREQAIEIARRAYGGEPEEWQVNLSYRGFARPDVPEYVRALNANKTMRLFYALWSTRGEVRIDSVTGGIIDFISPDQIGSGHGKRGIPDSANASNGKDSASGKSAVAKNELAHPSDAARGDEETNKADTPVPSVTFLVAGSLVVVCGSLFLLRRGWAARGRS